MRQVWFPKKKKGAKDLERLWPKELETKEKEKNIESRKKEIDF
jgi:hypothetical protein